MIDKRIRVGFVGLNPDSQWAAKSHLPALQFLDEQFVITGVANSTYQSAKRTADALQIPHVFANAQALVQSKEIDLVVITVKVPLHFELVKAALEAGKHVYCEHPLGNGLQETRQLAELAEQKGVVAVVGTQMVVAPEVLHLKQLINEGYVGKVLSTTLIGSGGVWTGETAAYLAYAYDKTNGATMLTIPLAHTLMGLQQVLGGFESITARMMSNYKTVKVIETGEIREKTSEDQIMVIGKLKSGAAISIHYRGGISKGTNLLWEINGTEGDLQITGPLGHSQQVPLFIRGASSGEMEMKPLTAGAWLHDGFPENPVIGNVARMYAVVAGDIRNNTRNAPSFSDAVKLHELLNEIELSANRGVTG